MTSPTEKPVIACFCAHFLPADMWHVYRQISGLQNFEPRVLTWKRDCERVFPFDPQKIVLVPKSPWRELQRFWAKRAGGMPWKITRQERRTLEQALAKSSAQLLHVYFGHIGVRLIPLLERWPHPKIVSFHGADAGVDLHKAGHRRAARVLFETVDKIFVRSHSLGRALEAIGAPTEKIRLQRTGIPLENWPFRKRAWPSDGQWRLLQTCRLIEKKGLGTSLRAFALLHRSFPRARFTIAGSGPLQKKMMALAEELGVADAVDWPGFLGPAELRLLTERSHLFLHPSEKGSNEDQEGIPNAMLEAMASGLPVATTNHGGIPEVIETEKNGILVAEGDARGLALALGQLMQNESRYRSLAEKGRTLIETLFSQERQIADLENLYREALQEKV